MKIATWNVNGIRARLSQMQAWVEREQPDVICLQEIKAVSDQVPAALCEMEGYWCYWHGTKGYSGVGLHIKKTFSPERPAFEHPAFDYESRIVTANVQGVTFASIYAPNGGKDFPAKMRFLEALRQFAADHRERARGHGARAGAGQRPDVHVVGPVAEHEGTQHRLAAGLRPGQRGAVRAGPALRHSARVRDQRSRSRRGDAFGVGC